MGFKFNPLTGRLDLVDHGNQAGPTTTTVSVPAGQSVTVDTVLLSTMTAVDYFISLFKADYTQTRSLKMTVVKQGSSVADSVYSRVGNNLDCLVVADVVGPNATIAITNNEAFNITCSFNKQTIN
jgi:hypothetical protein